MYNVKDEKPIIHNDLVSQHLKNTSERDALLSCLGFQKAPNIIGLTYFIITGGLFVSGLVGLIYYSFGILPRHSDSLISLEYELAILLTTVGMVAFLTGAVLCTMVYLIYKYKR